MTDSETEEIIPENFVVELLASWGVSATTQEVFRG